MHAPESMLSNCTLNAPRDNNESVVFLNTLLRDDRNSFYSLSEMSDKGWRDLLLSKVALLRKVARGLAATSAWYVSRNGFTSRNRASANARQINAFMFDIDVHNESKVSPADLFDKLTSLVNNNDLAEPTMVVDTGRGLHVYYVLDNSISTRCANGKANDKLVSWFKDIESRMAITFESHFCDMDGVDVDAAVYDLARVARIPGTYNAKAQRYARLLKADGPTPSLAELSKAFIDTLFKPKAPRRRRMTNNSTIYVAAQAQRARKIEMLQALRGAGCKGTRELMCFLHYNACAQAYDRELAAQKTIAFNEQFDTPLPLAEVRQAIRSVDSVELTYGPYRGQSGFYPISNAKLCNLLNVSADENTVINFTGNTAKARARAERKLQTARKREHRNKRIKDLKASGHTNREIAREVGVSLRTVVTVTNTTQSHLSTTHAVTSSHMTTQLNALEHGVTRDVQKIAPCIDIVMPTLGPRAPVKVSAFLRSEMSTASFYAVSPVMGSLVACQGPFEGFNPLLAGGFQPACEASLAFTAPKPGCRPMTGSARAATKSAGRHRKMPNSLDPPCVLEYSPSPATRTLLGL